MRKSLFLRTLLITAAVFGAATASYAQAPAPEYRFSFDFGFGWDKGMSGNINSSGVGRINNLTTVVLKNQYEDVYGTGLHIRFGGGYMLDSRNEVRAAISIQSLDADLVQLGEIGPSNLYGQYADYQSVGLDFGFRRYSDVKPALQSYAEASIGIAFVDETDVVLVAPEANLSGNATDFYDRTAAFSFAGNIGLLWHAAPKYGVFGQVGLRYVTGMSEVDGLAGTGLETINDKSGRWTIPFLFGIRARF
jgi:hypothetical protein